MSLWRQLVQTNDSICALVMRLTLGVVMFAHGAQKMLGWFGGSGFSGTMDFFTQTMGIPPLLAFLAIAAEFFGGLGLMVGFLARIAAFGIFCNMIVAVYMVHWPYGFFMNWSGNKQGEGFEYHLLALAIAVGIMILGAGRWSVDRFLHLRERTTTTYRVVPS